MSHCSIMNFIVGLERELMMPCLFLLSTDESDSEGGNCSLSHLFCAVACKQICFLTFTREFFMWKWGHCDRRAGALNLKCILKIVVHLNNGEGEH